MRRLSICLRNAFSRKAVSFKTRFYLNIIDRGTTSSALQTKLDGFRTYCSSRNNDTRNFDEFRHHVSLSEQKTWTNVWHWHKNFEVPLSSWQKTPWRWIVIELELSVRSLLLPVLVLWLHQQPLWQLVQTKQDRSLTIFVAYHLHRLYLTFGFLQ